MANVLVETDIAEPITMPRNPTWSGLIAGKGTLLTTVPVRVTPYSVEYPINGVDRVYAHGSSLNSGIGGRCQVAEKQFCIDLKSP
jgi:hypothetical protein